MRNRQRNRLLTTLVLVAAMSFVLGSEALASSSTTLRSSTLSTWLSSKAPKPGVTPMAGEPDSPTGAPLPPKLGPYPTGGSTAANWSLRFQWMLRTLLLQTPRRLP